MQSICRSCGALALLLLLGVCAALGDAPPPTCRSLSETLNHPRWLCLPMSRLVVGPTYSYSQAPPQTQTTGGGAPTDLAYYVGAEPVRLPAFLSWQMAGANDLALAVMGRSLALTAAEWRPEGVTADFTGGRARLAPAGPFGCLTRTVTVDLDRTPSLLVQIPECQGGWALKANDGGEAVDIALVPDTGAAGETVADVSAATGWHGTKTFALKLFATGGPSKALTCSRLQFIALPPAPAARRFLWEPHRLVSALSFGGGSAQAECTTALPDAQTVAQRLRVTRAGSGRLRLTGRFPDGAVQWDAAHQTLLLRGEGYHVALALSRPARWLGVRASALDWQTADRRTGQGTSGVWALEWDGVKAGEEIVVAARFAPTSIGAGATLAAARSAATPGAFAAALTRQEAAWDKRLASVPRPLDFTPRSVDPKGVTAADVRRSYGRAWVFFSADTLPPMPENGFPYPQVCAGKPSL